jgi:hypothetical protein
MAVAADAVDPDSMDPGGEHLGRARELSRQVSVQIDAALDGLLPDRRAAEVTVRLRDGSSVVGSLAASDDAAIELDRLP